MLIKRLIHRFRFLHPEPGVDGSGLAPEPAAPPAPEPVSEALADALIDPTATPEPAAAPASEPAAKPDPFGGLNSLLDGVGVEPKPEPTVEPKPPAQAAAVAEPAPKPVDAPKDPAAPMDLTPPEGMSERAGKRWAELTERVKVVPELERRATEATQQLDSVRRMVSDSGLAPDEFSNVLNLGKLYKSNSPQDLQAALTQIEGLRADIATRLGADVPGVDVLAQHPDLKARVDGMELPRDAALEMARMRAESKAVQQTQAQSMEFQRFQTTVQQAAQRMDTTLAQRAHMPGHAAKVAFIQSQLSDQAKLQQFVKTYQPEQWEAVVLMMYDAYTPPAAPAPAPAPQPLRPGNVSAGAPRAGQPKNAMDAVQNAFAAAGL